MLKVIQVLVPKSLLPVVLQETWSPGEGIPHKTTALGVYKLSGDEPPKTYQQKAFFSQGYVDETKNEEKINKEENLISYNTSKVYNRITELQKMLFKATHVEDNIPVINSSKINPKSIKTISSKREIRSLDVITLSAPQYLSSNEPPSVPPQLKLRKAPFYLSRLDLTGVHFVVTTINVSTCRRVPHHNKEQIIILTPDSHLSDLELNYHVKTISELVYISGRIQKPTNLILILKREELLWLASSEVSSRF